MSKKIKIIAVLISFAAFLTFTKVTNSTFTDSKTIANNSVSTAANFNQFVRAVSIDDSNQTEENSPELQTGEQVDTQEPIDAQQEQAQTDVNPEPPISFPVNE